MLPKIENLLRKRRFSRDAGRQSLPPCWTLLFITNVHGIINLQKCGYGRAYGGVSPHTAFSFSLVLFDAVPYVCGVSLVLWQHRPYSQSVCNTKRICVARNSSPKNETVTNPIPIFFYENRN